MSTKASSTNVFNYNVKRLQLDRAIGEADSSVYDYLKDEVASRVTDRIFDVKRSASILLFLVR